MAENSERKKCQQNLLSYVSDNLNTKVEKEEEKEKSEGKSSTDKGSHINTDKPSANSGPKQQRMKPGAQGTGN